MTRRLDYTVACARLLADLAARGRGGVGVHLAPGLAHRLDRGPFPDFGLPHLRLRAPGAGPGGARRADPIRLGLEPEPGCALETTAQAIAFWEHFLRPAAREAGLSEADLSAHVGLCYDTCHQAVQFEDACAVLDDLAAAGIPIAKMQLSSALEFKPDPGRRGEALRRAFCEERFLHQTRILTPDGLISFDDLPDALAVGAAETGSIDGIDLWAHPWRVHFHVPIDSPGLLDPARIGTTRDEMIKAYRHARAKGLCRHFEVETYTWSVMPEAHRPATDEALAECIARELRFVESLGGNPGE